MAKLTRAMIANSRVIAKGRGIRDVDHLVRRYGGKASQWVKKSSPPYSVGRVVYEYHWYEHHGIGRRQIKRKRIG